MHAVAFLFIAQYSLELLNNSKNWGGYLGKCIFANIISYLGCFSIGAFPECEAFPEIPHTHTPPDSWAGSSKVPARIQ